MRIVLRRKPSYVAHWTDGDLDSLRATADRVLAGARRIIDRLDPHPGGPLDLVGRDSAA